jgi:hypothetical protein
LEIEFDSAKDAANIAKHGISLARAADLDHVIVVEDDRYAERRFRLYGLIDGRLIAPPPPCAAASSASSTFVAPIERRCSVMNPEPPVIFDEENPEWTEADFAKARPISDFPNWPPLSRR